MDLKYLETFLILADNLNFTKSAEQLFISQSAISRQISSLEKEIGYPLFERSKRSVALTPHGEELIFHAKTLIRDYENLLTHMERIDSRESLNLNIGLMNDLYSDGVTKCITEFTSAHPEVNVSMSFMSPSRLFERFSEGSLDVLFTMIHPDMDMQAFDYRVIDSQHLMLAVNQDHPLAGRANVVLKDFSGEKLLCMSKESNEMAYEHARRIVKETGLKPRKIAYSSTVSHLLTKVSCGIGITFVTQTADLIIPKNIVLMAIDHAKAESKAVVIWNDNSLKISDTGFMDFIGGADTEQMQ